MTDNKEKEQSKKEEQTQKKPKELSEEDKEYKANIDTMVEGLFLKDSDLRLNSYNMIKKEVTTSTTSMTSIPRPLKFLREHYQEIKTYYENFTPANKKDEEYKILISELLAVLVMVITDIEDTSLGWILKGSKENITQWGQEFVRSLCAEIGTEYNSRLDKGEEVNELYDLVQIIVPFLITQHCENDAVDLLIEVEKLTDMNQFVNEHNYKKICLYLLANSKYSADTEEFRNILELVYNIYFNKFHEYVNALRVAIKMGNSLYINQTFNQCEDPKIKKQLAFVLARERIYPQEEGLSDEIIDILSNNKLTDYYKRLGKELEVLEPKHPEDIFKSHLEENKKEGQPLESYKINMAHSIASSFINAGFSSEVLLSKEKSDWLYKNKDEGITALLGGLGLVYLWDIYEGPGKLFEYAGSKERDPQKRAGRNIGLGVCGSGIHDDNDSIIAILLEQLEDKNLAVVISALFGIGLAGAGSQNEKLIEPLFKVFQDFSMGFEVSAFVSLVFGLIFIGSAKEDIYDELFTILLTRNEGGKTKLFESPFFVLYALGMGLICYGKQKDSDLMIETAYTLSEFPVEMRMYLKIMLTAFSYAGTGNVTKIQEMIQVIAKPKEEVHDKVKSIAVIGCSLIALGEEIGSEMLIRTFNHFLQFGDASVKKAVSLAMALLNLTNPKVSIIDSLTKFSYDSDKSIAINAIFSIGLVASGTNHSRVQTILRTLASYYSDDTTLLFMVRIAQGLVNLGKGLLTLNPLYSHNLLINTVGIGGILVALFSFTETEALICGKHQMLLYSLALAMQPKAIIIVDENLEPKNVQVMVGQAVDVAGQTGNPRTITGFQIHNTPTLLSTGERCELNGDDYKSYTDVLENIVIVTENKKEQNK